jgi:hypothetical protein
MSQNQLINLAISECARSAGGISRSHKAHIESSETMACFSPIRVTDLNRLMRPSLRLARRCRLV